MLQALLIVADKENSYMLTGNGDVIEPVDGVIGIGSGGDFALAAARALVEFPDLSAEDVARRSMKVASNMCVHTNDCYVVEKLSASPIVEPIQAVQPSVVTSQSDGDGCAGVK